MLFAAMEAPKAGGYLSGCHGFSENFWGSNGQLPRNGPVRQRVDSPRGREVDGDGMELTHRLVQPRRHGPRRPL